MSLPEFQRAFCELVASPQLCLAMRKDPERVLSRYALSDRERRRLEAIVRQRGMSTNCTLYRVNRITPIYTLLGLTCFLLDDRMMSEVEAFWNEVNETALQFKDEVERFGLFLKRRIAEGAFSDPFLEEVLLFELAENSLRFLAVREISRSLTQPLSSNCEKLRLHPLVKQVRFRHDPMLLLSALADLRRPSKELPTGSFYLLLCATEHGVDVKPIDSEVGALMETISGNGESSLDPADERALVESGIAIRV